MPLALLFLLDDGNTFHRWLENQYENSERDTFVSLKAFQRHIAQYTYL